MFCLIIFWKCLWYAKYSRDVAKKIVIFFMLILTIWLLFKCIFHCRFKLSEPSIQATAIFQLITFSPLQRGWLLKLLALELHSADMADSSHRETCMAIISQTFGECAPENYTERSSSKTIEGHASGFSHGTNKIKVWYCFRIVAFCQNMLDDKFRLLKRCT